MPSPTARAPVSTDRAAHPWPLLVALLAAVAAAQVWLVHDLRWLPSPLYGGDYVYQLGCVRSIVATRNPMASCSVSGALPGYLPLYGTLVAALALAGGLDALPAMLIGAVALRVFSAFIVYRVFATRLGRPTGFVMACLWAALHPELIVKYTEFTSAIVVPLYFLVLIRYLERPAAGRALGLGLLLAVLGYSHAVAFVGGIAIAGLAILVAVPWRSGLRGSGGELLRALRHAPIVAAASALALGYWYRPIFVYHGHASLHYVEWNGGVDFSTAARRLAWAGTSLAEAFSVADVPLAVLAFLIGAGAARFAFAKQRRSWVPAMIAAGATFVWMFHFLLTVPLLHTHFVPIYVRWLMWGFARLLVAGLAVAWAVERLRGPSSARLVQGAALAAAVAAIVAGARGLRADPAMVSARTPMGPGVTELTRYAEAHTDPEDVALSTNELSFAWAAVTGRRTMVTRRGQNDAFIDMDSRNRDAALILYGTDDTLRTRLLRRYGVKYVFWAVNWGTSEFSVTAAGDTTMNDALFYFRNADDDARLEAGGVIFRHIYGWVDPTLRGPDYPRFDLTVVMPENYQRPDRPWRDDLARRLEPVWSFPAQGRPLAVLYRVREAAAAPH